ncbi:MAG: proteasome assembly chaperone family protein [Candidatus Aenigmatarchaeota archaeon]
MTVIKVLQKPKLKNPILIVGLPGIGNIGRVGVGYLIDELKAKKFAELYSEHFFPFVILEENHEVKLLKNYLHYWKAKAKGRDLIFLTGDCQSQSSEGHYHMVETVLDFAKKLGVNDVITIGGLATGEVEEKPVVYGTLSEASLEKKYGKYKIDFGVHKKVGYIVGAAGLMLGLGRERGMKGICLLGETSGFPIVTDPKAAGAVLDVLLKIIGIKVNMKELDSRVKEMESFIKRIEGLQKKAVMEIVKDSKAPAKKDELRYIG